MNDLINVVGSHLGIAPATLTFYLILLMMICKVVARKIPDTATGWLGNVRLVCSWIGLHVKDNSGVPALEVADNTVIPRALAKDIPEGTTNVIEAERPIVTNAFEKAAAKVAESAVEEVEHDA